MKKTALFFSLFCSFTLFAQYPVFDWAAKTGGTPYAVETDAQGNVFTVGVFSGMADFDTGSGVFTLTSSGISDAYVTKYDSDGVFVWAFKLGGTSAEDYAYDIALDASGNALITGKFYGTNVDFDPGTGQYNLSAANSFPAIFVLKVDNNAGFLGACKIDGSGEAIGHSIASDPQGNIYVTGHFKNTVDFDPGAGAVNKTSNGGFDIFCLKLSNTGQYVYVNTFGDSQDDLASGLEYSNSAIYVSTTFKGTVDFDPDQNNSDVLSFGSSDIAISKFAAANGALLWVKSFGGANDDYSYGLKIDSQGNCYTIGKHSLNVDFDPSSTGTFNVDVGGVYASFIQKLDVNGNFSWVKTLNTGFYSINGIDIDQDDLLYFSGTFSDASIDLDPGAGTENYNLAGLQDFFVSSLDFNGNFVWGYVFGSSTAERSSALALNSTGDIHVAGSFYGALDFDPRSGTAVMSPQSGTNTFMLKLDKCAATFSTLNITSCESFTFDNLTYTNSGIYGAVIPNHDGCDSLVTLNLTINHASSSLQNEVSCESYTWPLNNETYTASGVYLDTIPNASGCDSVIVLNLIIRHGFTRTDQIVRCQPYTWPENGMTYSTSVNITEQFTTVNGCDSILILDLSIVPFVSGTETRSACDAFTWTNNNQTYLSSGVYWDTIPGVFGCDSIVTLNLTINSRDSVYRQEVACEFFFWDETGLDYTQSGRYYRNLINQSGCDSILVLDLTVIHLDADVALIDDTLWANTVNDDYKWMDCSSGLVIDGETDHYFVPPASGGFAVIVLSASCSDTSDCFVFHFSGLEEENANQVNISPNPFNETVQFESGGLISGILIFDLSGKLVYREQNMKSKTHIIDLSSLEKGSYFVELEINDKTIMKPLLKN